MIFEIILKFLHALDIFQVTTNYSFVGSVPHSWIHLISEELSLNFFWDIHPFIHSPYSLSEHRKYLPIRKSLPVHHLLIPMNHFKGFWSVGYILWSISCDLHCEKNPSALVTQLMTQLEVAINREAHTKSPWRST